MKTTAIPSVRVEPALRDQLAEVLDDNESLSAFVVASVRDAVQRRLDQREFIARGMASLAAARESGEYVEAEAVVRKLEARLQKARKPAAKR